MKYTFLILALISLSSQAAAPKIYSGNCGSTEFKVSVINGDHPLDNTYSMSAITANGSQKVLKIEASDWFGAACLPSKEGKQLLVYQSYCGGSACVEGKFGAIDPSSLKFILRPSPKNADNSKQISSILGTPAPDIRSLKNAFCCSK